MENMKKKNIGLDLLKRMRVRAGLDEKKAMALAVKETRAVRRKRLTKDALSP